MNLNNPMLLYPIYIIYFTIYLFIVIYIGLLLQDHATPLPTTKSNGNLKFAILLTMYIRNDKIRDLYIKNTNNWLNSTDLDIYIVISSGEQLPIEHPRLFQLAFTQPKDSVKTTVSCSERHSILTILNAYDFSKYDLVFKITGKYFCPEFAEILPFIHEDCDILFQRQRSWFLNNSELVGIKPEYISDILSFITENRDMEPALTEQAVRFKTYRINKYLKVDTPSARSNGSILYSL